MKSSDPSPAAFALEVEDILPSGLDRAKFECDAESWVPAPLDGDAARRLAAVVDKAVSPRRFSAGLAVPALTLLCEAAGRALLQDSLPSLLLAAWLRPRDGANSLAAGLVPGEQMNLSVDGDALSASATLRAAETPRGWRLEGVHPALPLAGSARPVVVSAHTDGGGDVLVSFAPQPHVVRYAELDPHLPFARVELPGGGVPAQPVLSAERWRARRTALLSSARLLVAAELCGIAEACLIRCVAYARRREQFGAPIGSFQAVSQRCADLYAAVEGARSLVHAQDGEGGGIQLADASMAKAQAGEAARVATRAAIQVMGAHGVSSTPGLHWALRRQLVLDLTWGNIEQCDRDIAAALAASPDAAERSLDDHPSR